MSYDEDNEGIEYLSNLVKNINKKAYNQKMQALARNEAQAKQKNAFFKVEQSHFFNSVTRQNFF